MSIAVAVRDAAYRRCGRPLDLQALRISAARKLLPDRRHYEIFNADRQ